MSRKEERTDPVPRVDDILEQAAAWHRGGQGVAIATVIKTWGSSPRPAGSQLIVNDAGEFRGSVSGGCIEGAVVSEAGQVIETGEGRVLHFGVTNEMAWEVGLACGGEVDIYLEKLL
jgi:xanthine/CO dehydrogenase XdhC/CoxF family maturation factor